MGRRLLKWSLSLLAVFLLLPVLLYWIADAWLESSGGRQMLEQELGARFGMSVQLNGEFDLMLLPDIGVSGTDLVIGGGAEPGAAFASSSEFEVSVALRPLLSRRVVVDWIRLTGGRVYPDRYSPSGEAASTQNSKLPEIRELTLRDFELVLDPDETSVLRVQSLRVVDFAEKRQTGFALDVENLLQVQGWLIWDTAGSKIEFGDVQFDMGGQLLRGEACLQLLEPPLLNAVLVAEQFDFDRFRESLPAQWQVGGAEDSGDLPLDIRARFTVDELRSNGVVARGVVLNLGPELVDATVCGSD